jgi:hypothetical protein
MDDVHGIAERETGTMTAAQQNVYRALERCPVCGSRRSGTATGKLAGALPVMRAFYACGYTVTAAAMLSGRVVIMGIGCRGQKK